MLLVEQKLKIQHYSKIAAKVSCLIRKMVKYGSKHISSPSYYVRGTFVNVKILDIRLLADLHVLGSRDSKKHKISMVSGYSLVNMLVSLLV